MTLLDYMDEYFFIVFCGGDPPRRFPSLPEALRFAREQRSRGIPCFISRLPLRVVGDGGWRGSRGRGGG